MKAKKNTTEKTPPINMMREYKKELTLIKRAQRGLARRWRTVQRQTLREISRIELSESKLLSGLDREARDLERRRHILEGRLS